MSMPCNANSAPYRLLHIDTCGRVYAPEQESENTTWESMHLICPIDIKITAIYFTLMGKGFSDSSLVEKV